ncbi:Multimodular transpeptidase-transglycosylase [Lachnospiraceae bacterium TWA4]|nr:Multimodular transpeptidase-transglycosylase [Lachnospiraceae bacterium TWA4]
MISLMTSFGIGMVDGVIENSPKITKNDVIPRKLASTIYDNNGTAMQTLVKSGSNRINIKDYNTIPVDLINAFVAIEDSRFWDHNGVDLQGIARAAYVGLTSGKFSEGASTITQQLIKNSVFSDWLSENSFGASLERKLQEQYLSIYLEKTMDKKDILLNYLNTINLGSNSLGVASASKRYFNKEYTELNLSESVILAAITNNPTKYNPINHPEENLNRCKKILSDMYEQGYITEEQEKSALDVLTQDKDNTYQTIAAINETYTNTVNVYSYFTDALIKQVIEDLQTYRGYTETQAYQLLYSGGLQIYTTLDQEIQGIVEEEVNNVVYYPSEVTEYSCNFTLTITHPDKTTSIYTEADLKAYYKKKDSSFQFVKKTKADLNKVINDYAKAVRKNDDKSEVTSISYTLQPQVSFVIMEQESGYVRGVAGGRGEKNTSLSLNRATSSLRQPGSTFKTLAAFAPAIDIQGNTLSTVYNDAPYSVNGKKFSNYWGNEYFGYSNIRQSIEYSMNIVALKCMNETVGIDLAYQYLENFGFTSLVDSKKTSTGVVSDKTPSLCLGGLTYGVTNLQNTAAYATIANKGVYHRPVFYTKILDQDGNTLISNENPESRTVIKETTAFLLTNAMQDVMNGDNYPGSNYLSATGKQANVEGISLAGKTGTTTSKKDIWFVGYSPYYTAGIWSGYDDNKSISNSENYHKKIWASVMRRVHEIKNKTTKTFEQPNGIVKVKVCKKYWKVGNRRSL